jgi:hypothetical protein
MGIATFPAASGGLSSAIKSIQRGEAVSAGNITITAVDTTKTMVNSFSTASTGAVAATGTVSAANGSTSGASTSAQTGSASGSIYQFGGLNYISGGTGSAAGGAYSPPSYSGRYGQYYIPNNVPSWSWASSNQSLNSISLNAQNTNGMNVGLNTTSISGGTTNLIAGVNGAYLSNSTTLVVTGACRYEVVEYN